MAINGIETILYRVNDLALCTRFFDDFGLPPYARDAEHTHYRLDEGSNVILKAVGDPSLPFSQLAGIGVVETIWGVDREDAFETLIGSLQRRRDLRRDADGTVHTHDNDGNAIGFRLFRKTPIFSAPDPVNSPGNVNRLNRHRKWYTKARPKTIQHVVFAVPDPEKSWAFYRDELNFRLSDVQRMFGIFGRADGAIDHHNIYFLNAHLPFPDFDGKLRFNHANFGVEDIDEVMVGANHMERCGWPKSVWGVGRHRIASSLFFYVPCPAGGEAEYGTDSDMLDESWVPRVWNPLFGTATFMHNIQPWIKDAPPWEVDFAPGYTPAAQPPEPVPPAPRQSVPASNGSAIEAQLDSQSVLAAEPVGRTQ